MSDEEIQKIVRETIALLPEQYSSKLTNVQILIERSPMMHTSPKLVGRYQATPTTERFTVFTLPEKIMIYKMPLLRISRTLDEARGNIRDTVLHELGYYFEIPDDELYRLKNKFAQNAGNKI
jgi:predicted Zn-dependent protease with MMP-like domain